MTWPYYFNFLFLVQLLNADNFNQCSSFFHPAVMPDTFKIYLSAYPECQNLPGTIRVFGHQTPAPALAGLTKNKNGLQWIAFAFESVRTLFKTIIGSLRVRGLWNPTG